MNKFILYTIAYNAEKTMERTIKSVVPLLEQNVFWYLVDNASTDSTGEIIKKYAVRYPRIQPLRNRKNHIWEAGNKWKDIISAFDDNDYFFRLDADDEYKPDFLEKMLQFVSDLNLDVAACGHDFIDELSGKLTCVRKLDRNIILEIPEHYGEYFPIYHQFMRTNWCKIIKLTVLRRYNEERLPSTPIYGGDTLFTMEVFRNANRIGILAESLHRYYVSPESSSYRFDENRIQSDRILDDAARSFLVDKCGSVSPQNDQFLNLVYFNAIIDTVKVLLHADVSNIEKLYILYNIITFKKTRTLFHVAYIPEEVLNKRLRNGISQWLLSQNECRTKEGAKITADVLAVMYTSLARLRGHENLSYLCMRLPEVIEFLLRRDYGRILERLQCWYKKHERDNPLLTELEIIACRALGKPNDELFSLLTDIRINRPRSNETLEIDGLINEISNKYPLLKNVSASLAVTFSSVVLWIIRADFLQAFEELCKASQKVKITGEDTEAYLLLAQNLAAATENADAYVFFKKLWVSFLLDNERREEAGRELDEFEQILPSDGDFAALRVRMVR